jgi:uncharacterized membrane protein YphA (DoxX/SURF4 family)
LLAGVFLYAGVVKAGASEEFLLALLPFTFLPVSMLAPVSVGLPWLEILAGVLILIPYTSRFGSWLAVGLLSAFMVVLVWALSQGIVVACSCFGKDEDPSVFKMLTAILRDLALMAVAFWLIFFRKSRSPE